MPKPTSAANGAPVPPKPAGPHVAFVTLDSHLASTVARAQARLRRKVPGLVVSLHAAARWDREPQTLQAARDAIASADIVIVCMLFMDDHIDAVRDALQARREHCRAMVCLLSAPEVCRWTRMGTLDMSKSQGSGMAWLKKLRGSDSSNGDTPAKPSGDGAKQMAVLRRLPQLLRFIPGTAQDLRIYFLSMQYWLLGSEMNVTALVQQLLARYGADALPERSRLKKVPAPIQYPDTGLYHPALKERISTRLSDLPAPKRPRGTPLIGTVGLIVMRSYVLAGNTAHYDGVIAALEQRGLRVIPVFASGLDARPAVETFLRDPRKGKRARVDAILSLTGFSLVGGPAYNDADAAQTLLSELGVPYLSATALEFQSLAQWRESEQGLLPLESMMMVAIPELDGATGTAVFGGRESDADSDLACDLPQAQALADRVCRMVKLRRTPRAQRKVAVVLYDFPPNSGGTGTAAYLSVFQSLYNLIKAMAQAGYAVDVPQDCDALRQQILEGNSTQFGTAANVCAQLSTDSYVADHPHLAEIEAAWGPAPGKHLSDGRSLLIQGAHFGDLFVGVQPAFGYEGDPMKLMFQQGLAPTHAFYAFYRYLREALAADAVLHFGTHGALEFMPGKQVGMSQACWPSRLLGDLPHVYLYAANNPSEASIAKRRANATTVSYLTPTLARSGLYRAFADLRGLIEHYRTGSAGGKVSQSTLAGTLDDLRTQAAELELLSADDPAWRNPEAAVLQVREALLEMEQTLVPQGLHVLGEVPSEQEIADLIVAVAAGAPVPLPAPIVQAAINSDGALSQDTLGLAVLAPEQQQQAHELARMAGCLREDSEIPALLRALDGDYIRPVAGGDLLRNPAMLPTGRNLHGFDPTRMPSAVAVREGAQQAEDLLLACQAQSGITPRRLAMVLWGTDNLKNEGVGIGEALALMGAKPRFDAYGRLSGADLIPLSVLGRPRVDVLVSISGIFRDLLPKQIALLADAARKCALADESDAVNPIRELARRCAAKLDISLEEAALRVFGNADSAYGANVNQLVENGLWQSEDELGAMFMQRRSFAYSGQHEPSLHSELLELILAEVDVTFQNLDSLELGITSLDHYVDSLGGVSRAVENASGSAVPTLVGDYTQGSGKVRTLTDQVALESRTRMLNPRWYETMLEHGYEGVHQIESHFTNFVGWSATTGQVDPWIYRELSRTYILDPVMRERLASLNPLASVKMVQRMLEAHERDYWSADPETLSALQDAEDALEDRYEGVVEGASIGA
ncbi:MAG: magnesium chelatase subunit H [Pseudomonadota bacterium]